MGLEGRIVDQIRVREFTQLVVVVTTYGTAVAGMVLSLGPLNGEAFRANPYGPEMSISLLDAEGKTHSFWYPLIEAVKISHDGNVWEEVKL